MHRRTIIRNLRDGYAAIIGELAENDMHAHYSLHYVGSSGGVTVEADGQELDTRYGVVVASWAPHVIHHEAGMTALVISASPLGRLGRSLSAMLGGAQICNAPSGAEPDAVMAAALALHSLPQDPAATHDACGALVTAVNRVSDAAGTDGAQATDPRVVRALQLLAAHTEGFLAAGAVAERIGLSESRFLHLFREQVGMSYRRMQRWVRLAAAFESLCTRGSLTETAHEFGFSDSAHFSRAFHEAFGMAPSVLVHGSRFVQV